MSKAVVTDTGPGVLPYVNDLLAALVLFAVYYFRLGAAADPAVSTPFLLSLTTDFLLPFMAASWLWIAAMYALVRRLR